MKELIQIQSELKAPKGNFNSFGKYHYRSQEDILEALKPLLLKYECVLSITDEVKQVGTFTFIESRATLIHNSESVSVTAQAGISDRKGMDIAQSFGSSSSYARKYALNGLFLIDDTKDADASNTHGKDAEKPTKAELDLLFKMLNNIPEASRSAAVISINNCQDYDTYAKIQHRLEDLQLSIDQIPNPSQKNISKHIKQLA